MELTRYLQGLPPRYNESETEVDKEDQEEDSRDGPGCPPELRTTQRGNDHQRCSLNVLFITSAYPATAYDPRGAFIEQLATSLAASGIRVTVLAPGSPAAPSKEHRAGVEVQRATYWVPRWQHLAADFGGIVPTLKRRPWLVTQVPALVVALSRHALRLARDADLIHAHWMYPAGIAGAIASRYRRIPLVVTSHGTDYALAERHLALRVLSRWVVSQAAKCTGVGQDLVEGLRILGVPSERLEYLPLGVATRPATPADGQTEGGELQEFREAQALRLLYVGRLVSGKSVETLLQAHRMLERQGHPVTSALLGSGPEEGRLRDLSRDSELQHVLFLGARPPAAVRAWMSAADLLVLPSLSEGRGIVIVEAMAQGTPAIASDIPGPRDLIEDGRTGLLFPPGDAAALAQCVERLIGDPAYLRQLGQNARERIVTEGLSLEQSTQRHISLYRSLLKRH